jgi:hypothetical protein
MMFALLSSTVARRLAALGWTQGDIGYCRWRAGWGPAFPITLEL